MSYEYAFTFISDMQQSPQTGGERYNDLVRKGLAARGYTVHAVNGGAIPPVIQRIPGATQVWLLFAAFGIDPKTICLCDTGFCTKFILGMFWIVKIRKCRIIGILHHYNFETASGFFKRVRLYAVERFASRSFHGLLVNSVYNRQRFRSICSPRPAPSVVLSPPIPKGPCAKPVAFHDNPLQLLFIGNVEPRKNLAHTLAAVALTTRNCRLHIVGRWVHPGYVKKLQRDAARAGVEKRVVFHGFLGHNRVEEVLLHCSVFIMVSYLEGFGMVYAEAMRYGLPIIGSNRGAIPEVVQNNVNGILCDPDSPQEIARAIEKMHDKNVWHRFQKTNLHTVASFSDIPAFTQKSTHSLLSLCKRI